MDLVHQSRPEGVLGEVRAADADVAGGRLLHPTDGLGVELALEPRARRPHGIERAGVHDLVEPPPQLGVLDLGDLHAGLGDDVSQTAIVSYIRRP